MKKLRLSSFKNCLLNSAAGSAGVCALAVSLSVIPSGPAFAQSFVVPDGAVERAKTMNNDGDTGLIELGGAINVSGLVSTAVAMNGNNQILTNAGDIIGAGFLTIGVDSTGSNATISNSGTIDAGAVGDSRGIRSTGANVSIDNTGFIITRGNNAIAILSGGVDALIVNQNAVTTLGVGSHGIQSTSTGLRANIINLGTIRTGGQTAHGIESNGASSSIKNAGAIETGAINAHGVESTGDSSTIVNTNSIDTAGINAHGVQSTGVSSTVNNSGTINTVGGEAHGITVAGSSSWIVNYGALNTAGLQAHGIELTSNAAGSTIINNGVIRTFGLEAHGAESLGFNAIIYNNGSIIALGFDAKAISALGDNGRVFNSGYVKSNDIAILLGGDDSILTLQPGSVIEGGIEFLGNLPSLALVVENGLSINKTLTGALPGTINPNGAPMATRGLQVAVVDPTNLSTQDEQLADLTGGISSALENRLSGVRNGAAAAVTTSGAVDGAQSDPGHPFWTEGFGSYRQQDASSPAVETDQWVGGFVIGADDLLRDDLRAGFFGGAAWGGVEAEFNSQETDSRSFFVGSYASLLRAGLIFDVALTAGYSEFEQERSVANNVAAGGLETATADFSGWFVSPELTVTKPAVLMGRRLEGSLSLRYAGLFLDGYTESGTTAPLTVDDRDVHIGVARLQVAAPYETVFADGSAFRYRVKAGIEARTNFGGETIDGALLGQNISFNPGGDDDTFGGYAGLSGEYDTGSGFVLTAGTEGLIDTVGSYQLSGRAGVSFRF